MATKREIVYDIITILTKAGYSDDSRLDEDYVGYKVDQKRSALIKLEYERTKQIDPMWLQDYGITPVTPINFPDDDNVNDCPCDMWKLVIPPVVSFSELSSMGETLGVYALTSICGTREFHYMPIMKLKQIPSDSYYAKFNYYAKIHNAIYINQNVKQVRPILVLERPLDGFVIDSTYKTSGTLVIGQTYEVFESQVIHNALGYNPGQTFVAVNANYTGAGKLKLANEKRAMTDEDEYPLSATQTSDIILSILTNEYGIENKKISDIRNNSRDDIQTIQEPISSAT